LLPREEAKRGGGTGKDFAIAAADESTDVFGLQSHFLLIMGPRIDEKQLLLHLKCASILVAAEVYCIAFSTSEAACWKLVRLTFFVRFRSDPCRSPPPSLTFSALSAFCEKGAPVGVVSA
jgi:hypothetical protein